MIRLYVSTSLFSIKESTYNLATSIANVRSLGIERGRVRI
jgi:hypothetical protein